jgi:nicotinamidase-related amidase
MEASLVVPIQWQDDSFEWPDRVNQLIIEPRKTALVVVDVQNYGTFDDRVVTNTLRLLTCFRKWNLPVFFLRVGSMLPDASDVHRKRRVAVGRHVGEQEEFRCPKGSWGFEIKPELTPLATEMVIDKNSSGAFNSTSIDHYLRNMDVQS